MIIKETIENEDIDKLISKDKGNVIENNVIKTPDYSYGANQEPLNGEFQVRNISSGGLQVKLGSFTITGTGNITITGLGFKPKIVRFDVCDQSGSTRNTGTGVMTETQQYAINNYNSGRITTNCIYYGDPVKARLIYVSMDNDGFTVNCSYFVNISYVNYTAFG